MDANITSPHPRKLHLCRLCLLHKDSLVNIHERNATHGFVIAVEINDLLQLNVFPGDGLPDAICFDCLFDLSRFKRFKRNSHEAEVTLRYIMTLREVNAISAIQTALTGLKEENLDEFDSQTGDSILEENFLLSSGSEEMNMDDIHLNQQHSESGVTDLVSHCSGTRILAGGQFVDKVGQMKHKRNSTEKPHGTQVERKRYPRKYNSFHTTIKEEKIPLFNVGGYASKGIIPVKKDKVRQDGRIHDGNIDKFNPSSVEISFTSQNISKCTGCITVVSDNCSFKSHIASGSCNSFFKCHKCKESFMNRISLMEHNISCHTSVLKSGLPQGESKQENEDLVDVHNLQCQSCPYKGNESHQINSTKEMQVSFNKQSEDGFLENYQQNCNNSVTILMKHGYKCDKCGSYFRKKSIFERHLMKYHSQKLTFNCVICCKTFVTKSGLKEHMVVHSTERPFMCDICGNTFKLRKKLLRHMRTCHSKNS